jgi:hypothetical protein
VAFSRNGWPLVPIPIRPEGYYAVNPAISYAPPWDERIRLTLTAAIYGGRNKFKSFFFRERLGVFKNAVSF